MSSKQSDLERMSELARLQAMTDESIDVVDIPEAPVENWQMARRGDLYRPVKQSITIRLDADILAWFKQNADGAAYQTEINRVLRQHVVEAEKKRA
ncbi:BrnA antitoxin family protein [Rhizobium oryzicola]|uniref:BrnA antitoxin family protein n=1 Tax=Rhizobium oryzicola TaxID=1232668 RepID=A0ABT8SSJ3_9HYPH|nr:BrnA antitoxin family protein [Rhizobium oryzicola]MDO1581351.1 BrnA antitoxin family protein [Rhizobium oryzicola]